MDLCAFLRILRRWWPIALVALLVTATLTVAFVVREPSMYESTSTFVIRPRAVDADDGLRALDTLARGVEINATYAAIARSDRIKERAAERVGDAGVEGHEVTTEIVSGTNILKVVVTGPDAERTFHLNTDVGRETVAYVAELQDVFELAPLEAPNLPRRPVTPNRPLRAATGLLFGLVLAGAMPVLAEGVAKSWERGRRERQDTSRRLGEATGRVAFHDELDHAIQANRGFSVAVLKVCLIQGDQPDEESGERLRHFRQLTADSMDRVSPDGAVGAYLGNGTFALMLAGTSAEVAGRILGGWRSAVLAAAASNGHGHGADQLRLSTGVLRYWGLGDTESDAGGSSGKLSARAGIDGTFAPPPFSAAHEAAKRDYGDSGEPVPENLGSAVYAAILAYEETR